jgi:hypothetical protein
MVVFLVVRAAQLARYYEPSLRLLAERGHHIHIGFPYKPKGGDRLHRWIREYAPLLPGEPASAKAEDAAGVDLLSRMAAEHPSISWGYLRQRRADNWIEVLTTVRLCHDYLRFFDTSFADAAALRERAVDRGVPVFFQSLMQRRLPRSASGRHIMRRFLAACQQAIPVSRSAVEEIMDVMPDVVLVARLVDFASVQDDYVGAAHYLGIPVGLPVASWDNLTNKGLIRVSPDFVTVWNEFQKREAVEFHGMPESKVWVTGAQNFDVWFERRPSVDREVFCQRFGFDPGQAIIAYLGSSRSIAGNEVEIVLKWLTGLRSQDNALMRNASVIIRPHPYHAGQWEGVDLSSFGPVEVWPRGGVTPLTDEQRNDFYNTLYHAGAIVGLNTSAQIEAAILGRPVLVLIDPSASASRKGTVETLHFRYLSDPEHGIATVAETSAEHFAQLGEALRHPQPERSRRFVQEFLRPHGLDRPAAPILANAIERGAETKRKIPKRTTPTQLALRTLLMAFRPIIVAQQRKMSLEIRAKKRRLIPDSTREGN